MSVRSMWNDILYVKKHRAWPQVRASPGQANHSTFIMSDFHQTGGASAGVQATHFRVPGHFLLCLWRMV